MTHNNGSGYQNGIYGNLEQYVLDENKFSQEISVSSLRKYLGSLSKRQKILDVGCADGLLLAPLTKKHKVYGLDIARSLVKIAKKKGIHAKVADLEKGINYGDELFDTVIVHHVLEHLLDSDKLLSECNRVLKKSGTLFLTFPNTTSPVTLLLFIMDLPPYLGARYRSVHVRDFTLKTAKIALANNGFKVEEVYGGSFLVLKNNLFSVITKFLPRLGADITLRAKKVKNVHRSSIQFYDFGLNRKKFLKD